MGPSQINALRALLTVLLTNEALGRSVNKGQENDIIQTDKSSECHGMTCEDWDNVLMKLKMVEALKTGKAPSDAETAALAEGCLWYTEDQVDSILNNIIENMNISQKKKSNEMEPVLQRLRSLLGSNAGKRKLDDIETNPDRKWHNPIFFKFDGTHNDQEKMIIRKAFEQWQASTCLRFFEVPSYAPIYQSHLNLTKSLRGCYSYVGRVFDGGQPINLDSSCLSEMGIPLHEIGHALGFWHEHQRQDRDKWVTVYEDRVDFYQSQFWEVDTMALDVPYDYTSVMHYPWTAGSYRKKQTIEAHEPMYTQSMGQRIELTFLDIKLANKAYCSNVCKKDLQISCSNGGYQDPSDCKSCLCPDGFSGQFCDDVAPSDPVSCGEEIKLDYGQSATINSPGYHTERHYEDYQQCHWRIHGPTNSKLMLYFPESTFGIYSKNNEVCFHWLEVKYRTGMDFPGPRFCGYSTPSEILLSDSNEMVIIFRSNFPTSWSTDRRGFEVVIQVVNDGLAADIPIEVIKTTLAAPTTTFEPTTDLPGTAWSDWGWCQNNQCKCGGCSVSKRYRMCGDKRCTGDMEMVETKPCDQYCGTDDVEIKVIKSQFVIEQCPICCLDNGFIPMKGKCVAI